MTTLLEKTRKKIFGRRACCAAQPCWRSRANSRSITISKGEGMQGMSASQGEIREMSHSATNFLCDLGHDISSLK